MPKPKMNLLWIPCVYLSTYLPPTSVPGAPILPPPRTCRMPSPCSMKMEICISSCRTIPWPILLPYIKSACRHLALHNDISDRDYLEVGQKIRIPKPSNLPAGPDFKIIPDSEVGQQSIQLNVQHHSLTCKNTTAIWSPIRKPSRIKFIRAPKLWIASAGKTQFIRASCWPFWNIKVIGLPNPSPMPATLEFPIRFKDPNRMGLYKQLSWAADQLNLGFYTWQINAVNRWTLIDGKVIAINP